METPSTPPRISPFVSVTTFFLLFLTCSGIVGAETGLRLDTVLTWGALVAWFALSATPGLRTMHEWVARPVVWMATIVLFTVFNVGLETMFSPFGTSLGECNYVFQGYAFLTTGSMITPWGGNNLMPTFGQATGWTLLGYPAFAVPFFLVFGFSHATATLYALMWRAMSGYLLHRIMREMGTPPWMRWAFVVLAMLLWPNSVGRPEEAAVAFGLLGFNLLFSCAEHRHPRRTFIFAAAAFGVAIQFHLSSVAFFAPATFFMLVFLHPPTDAGRWVMRLIKDGLLFLLVVLATGLPTMIYCAVHLNAVAEQYGLLASDWGNHPFSFTMMKKLLVRLQSHYWTPFWGMPYLFQWVTLFFSAMLPFDLATRNKRIRVVCFLSLATNLIVLARLNLHGYELLYFFVWSIISAAALLGDWWKAQSETIRRLAARAGMSLALGCIVAATVCVWDYSVQFRAGYAKAVKFEQWLQRSIPEGVSVMAKEHLCYTLAEGRTYYTAMAPFEAKKADYIVLFGDSIDQKTIKRSFRPTFAKLKFRKKNAYKRVYPWLERYIKENYVKVAAYNKVFLPSSFWKRKWFSGKAIILKRKDLPQPFPVFSDRKKFSSGGLHVGCSCCPACHEICCAAPSPDEDRCLAASPAPSIATACPPDDQTTLRQRHDVVYATS